MKITTKASSEIFGIDKDLIKIFIVPVVLALVGLMIFGVVIKPKIDLIGSTNQSADGVDKKTKAINEKNNYLMSMNQEELKTNANYLSAAIIHEKNAYYLVNVVRSIAEKYGYQVAGFSVSPGKVSGTDNKAKPDTLQAQTLPISLTLIGPKDKYIDLMIAFERSLPILSVGKFEMKTIEGNSEIDLTVSAYYIGDKVTLSLDNLSLADLTLNKDEAAVVGRISNFEKIVDIVDQMKGGTSGQKYVLYNRNNPFNF